MKQNLLATKPHIGASLGRPDTYTFTRQLARLTILKRSLSKLFFHRLQSYCDTKLDDCCCHCLPISICNLISTKLWLERRGDDKFISFHLSATATLISVACKKEPNLNNKVRSPRPISNRSKALPLLFQFIILFFYFAFVEIVFFDLSA